MKLIKMIRKYKNIAVILIISLFFLSGCVTSEEEKAYIELSRYLEKTYGEEFYVSPITHKQGRFGWYYEAYKVYPKSYTGTSKEYDNYYHGKGFVYPRENFRGGDTYGKVLLNESANEFYLPKLKELFGENVLPVLNIEGYYEKTDFQEEMARRREFYKEDPDGEFFPISGGIYIFGRVENDEDREKYREEIYKFLSFMKETGTFEYVDLDILVIDERILLDEFKNNTIGTLTELNEINEKYVSEDKFLEKREKIMNKLNIYFDENKYYKSNIDEINRNNLRKDGAAIYTRGNNLLYLKAYSPKYIKSQKLDNREIREYNSISDVKFDWERWQ